MLPRFGAENHRGSLVRKSKTGESNNATVSDLNPLWDSILRDILIPGVVHANGVSSPFDADTLRALFSPEISAPAAAADNAAGPAPGIVATIFAGAAQPGVPTPTQTLDWLHTRFGADDHGGGMSGASHIALSDNGLGTAVGSVSIGSLGADIAALAQNALINFGDRAIIGASEGDLAGGMFLVVDVNGQAGFQYGEDEILVLFKGLPSTDLAADVPLF